MLRYKHKSGFGDIKWSLSLKKPIEMTVHIQAYIMNLVSKFEPFLKVNFCMITSMYKPVTRDKRTNKFALLKG